MLAVAPRPGPKPPFNGLALSELTPLLPLAWKQMMESTNYSSLHPAEADEVMVGLTSGMDIGFTGDRSIPRDSRNLPSATDVIEVTTKVTQLIRVNIDAGKTSEGEYVRPVLSGAFNVSPIGAVPKRPAQGQERKLTDIRVIHHLSHPFDGDSINNNSVDIYVKLGSFDQAMAAVLLHGAGCHMTKIDVKAAYKLVPVRYEDWSLLGFRWQGLYHYERTLPFGLKSSCRQWEAYATAYHHALVVEVKIPSVIHYVDDFLFVEQSLRSAQSHLDLALGLAVRIGLPIAHDKTEGPTTKLTFLGIELDSVTMTARLSADRLIELTQLLDVWVKKRTATITELQSLTGVLNWAAKVVRPGRLFLRRIIDHSSSLPQADRMTQRDIPTTVFKDIKWWREFVSEWNGVSLFYNPVWVDAGTDLHMFTDACNTGYGARCGRHWIAGEWSPKQLETARNSRKSKSNHLSMPYLELLALVIAVTTWAALWPRQRIILRSDCVPVVQAIANASTSSTRSMTLVRHLYMTAARYDFEFTCTHIRGVANVDADNLSRGQLQIFLATHGSTVNQEADQVRAINPRY